MIQSITLFMVRLFGWKVKGELPPFKKYVLIGAPHTSNWDFILMLAVSFSLKQKFHWMGKDNLFVWPFSKLFIWLGGIPINRRVKSNAVQTVASKFQESDSMVLVITPEGTRKKVARWKTGFYFIALKAKVPVVLGFADYRKKEVGLGPSFLPTGDIEADFLFFENFYKTITGKFSKKKGSITHSVSERKAAE
ncbi:MAG: lysophospholipid acyltransferase family protein [Nitrospinota bacterium]